MNGTLHIFRRRVVNAGDFYQVNYTTAGSTFARVFDSQQELHDFRLERVALY